RDEPPDQAARDRFARMPTGVTPVPTRETPGSDDRFDSEEFVAPTPARVTSSGGPQPIAALAGLSPGRRAMKPLAAVAIGVAALAGFIAWHSRPAVSPIGPQAPVVVASPALPTTAPASNAAASSDPDQLMVVAVQGRVRHPGLVKLSPGA